MTTETSHESSSHSRQALGKRERRVLGVLVEKAKTTPDSYPLSIAGLVAGCNQKSNRDPLMHLDEESVADALDNLKRLGAVREVQGSGRVNKYRHAAYEWFAINAPQAAVMTELLLRGPQTAGELRARASRMEPFNSLDELVAVVEELVAKSLVLPLTPPGRGQVFGHNLYSADELAKLRSQVTGGLGSEEPTIDLQAEHDGSTVSEGASVQAISPDLLQQALSRLAALESRVKHLENELGITGS